MTDQDQQYEKIEEARALLEAFGFDAERSNERSALVLLSLLKLKPEDPWTEASKPMLGTRAVMDWIRDQYGVEYKPNTRETIRRFTLHQFVEAGLVIENPDQPDRPVNSPKWNYQIEPRALEVIQHLNEPDYDVMVTKYLTERPGLKAQYDAARELERIPISLPQGEITLSPGGQNLLIKQMVEEFCAYYAHGGEILYIGDADEKWMVFNQEKFNELGVKVDSHGKMPDLVVYLPDKNWLLLMEAASSHGPVDAKRYGELSRLFRDCTAGLVYVSCFPDRATMRKYLTQIAWETEVWCADNPTHLIHFNGERFLGPYEEK